MEPAGWQNVVQEVLGRGDQALDWGIPEPWIHVELYRALVRRADETGWRPMPAEIPYCTRAPVVWPRRLRAIADPAFHPLPVKFADLCLQGPDNHWCWFELKVRTISRDKGGPTRDTSRDGFLRDVAALRALDVAATAALWEAPDPMSKAWWFEKLLGPRVEALRTGQHSFVAAFLNIGAPLSGKWLEADLTRIGDSWHAARTVRFGHDSAPAWTPHNSHSNTPVSHGLMLATGTISAPTVRQERGA